MKPEENTENLSFKDRAAENIETAIENILFHSRWLLAPLYLGAVLVLAMFMVKFVQEVFYYFPQVFSIEKTSLIIVSLTLVDLILIANLLLIVIFSGYENFVSKIDMVTEHVDRPDWMGTVDYSALKLKLIGSIVAISSIELLKAFINMDNMPKENIGWMIGIHLTFVVSGLLFAIGERVYHPYHHPVSHDHSEKH
jgi:uncharacterized protein (TIGR00645 family)